MVDPSLNILEQFTKGLKEISGFQLKIFPIVLGYELNKIPVKITESISTWSQNNKKILYGIHFNQLNRTDVSILKDSLLDIQVTAFVYDEMLFFKDMCPVLLYLTHLSLGENGAKGIYSLSRDNFYFS